MLKKEEFRTGAALWSLECYSGNMNNAIQKVSHLLSEYPLLLLLLQCENGKKGYFCSGFNRKLVHFMEKSMFYFQSVFSKYG